MNRLRLEIRNLIAEATSVKRHTVILEGSSIVSRMRRW